MQTQYRKKYSSSEDYAKYKIAFDHYMLCFLKF
jgi:hypothetical protein